MSVTILMDPGKMLQTASSLIDAAAKTRGSANALGALSSPPPGVPASVAGRVTGATSRAKGALRRQADLIESLANDMKTRAAFAVAADAGGQIAGVIGKVAGLADGVGQAVGRYETRQSIAGKMRQKGTPPNEIRDKVDRQMAKQYGVMGLSANRQAQLQQNGRFLEGPNGRNLSSRSTTALKASLLAQFKGPGFLSALTTGVTHVSTLANPYLTRAQQTRQIANDTASAAVGAAPAAAATAAFGGPIGLAVAGLTIAGDMATGGKVSKVSDTIGEAIVTDVSEIAREFGKDALQVAEYFPVVRAVERAPIGMGPAGQAKLAWELGEHLDVPGRIVRGAQSIRGDAAEAGKDVGEFVGEFGGGAVGALLNKPDVEVAEVQPWNSIGQPAAQLVDKHKLSGSRPPW